MDVEVIDVDSEVGEGENECKNVGDEVDINGDGAAYDTPSNGSIGEATLVPPPAVGMVFPSMEAVDAYYRSYGIQQGFGVVRAASSAYVRRDGLKQQPRNATWTCDRYGKPHCKKKGYGKRSVIDPQLKKDKVPKRSKKCECPVMIYASINGVKEWQLRKAVNEHKNHQLSSAIFKNHGTPSNGSGGEATLVPPPAVGMVFPSMEAIDTYYRSYGKQQGFAVVRAASSTYTGVDGIKQLPRYATWTCDHYGRPDCRLSCNGKKDAVARSPKISKKCECSVMIYAGINEENKWQLKKVVNEHKNHQLSLPVLRKITTQVKRKLNSGHKAGLEVAQIQNMLEWNPANSAGHDHGLDHSHGPNQHTLPDHAPIDRNVVNYSTPTETQSYRDSHEHVQEHLDGANVGTSPAIVQANESSRTFVVKATYKEDLVKVNFSLSSGIGLLKEEIGKKLNLEVGKFKMKYQDEDNDWVLVACISDLKDALHTSESCGSNVVRLSIMST